MAVSKKVWWLVWVLGSVVLAGVLAMQLFTEQQKTWFLPGQTSHGHHQAYTSRSNRA